MTGIFDNVEIFLKDTDLNEQELLDLSSMYNLVLMDHNTLTEIALKRDMTLAKAYYECVRARELISDKIVELRARKA